MAADVAQRSLGLTGSVFVYRGHRTAGDSSPLRTIVIDYSPFLIGRMFVREPSWEYSANLAGS